MATQKTNKQAAASKNKEKPKGIKGKGQGANTLNSYLESHPTTLIIILIITALVFANSLGNSFIENLDDNAYILQNQLITQLNLSSIKEIFSSFFQGNYHPLTLLSFAIEYKFFGLSPFAFHLTNYILHLANTALVYVFLRKFTGKIWVASITALFFGIHPMHVESVAWITERKDVLYSLFFLLSLISYANYLVKERGQNFVSLIWAFIWFFLSLLSKPAAVCLPLVLVLMDFYHSGSSLNKISRRLFISKIPFFALALLFGILAILSQRSFQTIKDLTPLFSIFDRIFLVCYSIIFYLFKAFVPFNLSVMHYYPVKENGLLPFEYYLALPVLLLLIWGVLKAGRFRNELIFGLLFYFFTIVLELQLIPVGQTIVSERYSYIPYIGVFFIAGQFFSYVKNNQFKFKGVGTKFLAPTQAIFILFIALCAVLTIQRNRVWKNGETLFTDAVSKYPKEGWNWYALGNSRNDKKDYDTAVIDYSKAIDLGTNFADVYFNRANSENNKKDFLPAISDYGKVSELNASFGQAYLNRGNCEKELKQFDAALNDYSKAIEFGLNSAYFNRGVVEDEKKDFNAAIDDYSKALQFDIKEADTTYAQAYFNRGNTKNEKMEIDAAIADYTKAIELNPNYASAYLNRGATENEKKDFDNAIRDFTSVINLTPNSVSAYFNRGIIENEKNDLNAAIRDYSKALELDPTYNLAYQNRGFARYAQNDKEGACKDWQLALQYGNPQAAATLNQYCK